MKKLLSFVLITFGFGLNTVFAQWQLIPSGITSNLVDGQFLNDTTAFILSSDGKILKTQNSGITWKLLESLPGNFTNICVADEKTLYAAGSSIFCSTDTGNSWTQVSTPGFLVYEMKFITSQIGFVTVADYQTCTYMSTTFSNANFHLYKTLDGGLTWTKIFDYLLKNHSFQIVNKSDIFLFRETVTYGYHCMSVWGNSSQKSIDGGISWININKPEYFNGIFSMINKDTGYLIHPNLATNLYTTYDGGMSYQTTYTELPEQTIRQMIFNNLIDGFIVGQKSIYETKSKGLAWKLDFSGTIDLNAMFISENNSAITIGKDGIILHKNILSSTSPDTIRRISTNIDSLKFGYTALTDTSIISFQLQNTGTVPLTIDILSPENFTIKSGILPFTSTLTLYLDPFQSITIDCRFRPTHTIHYNDSLTLSSNGVANTYLNVSGIGYYGIGGLINKDTLLCADTLRLGKDLLIDTLGKVTICAGTNVLILGKFEILVKGEIIIQGTETKPVNFILNNLSESWKGIRFDQNPIHSVNTLQYCNLNTRCTKSVITLDNGSINLDHCTLSNSIYSSSGISSISSPWQNNSKLKITNCTISNIRGTGINCANMDTLFLINNEIFGCVLAVDNYSGNALIAINNSIHDNSGHGISSYGYNYLLNNRIYNNKYGGVLLQQSMNNEIINNQIYNNDINGGLVIYNTKGITNFSQNLIYNNTSHNSCGGFSFFSNNVEFTELNFTCNTICNNNSWDLLEPYNVYISKHTNYPLNFHGYNNIIYSKDVTNNLMFIHPDIAKNMYYNMIFTSDISMFGDLNLNDNPDFVKTSKTIGYFETLPDVDWSLNPGSSCINAGNPDNFSFLQTTDLIGNPRIFNGLPDIGAIEFQDNKNQQEGNSFLLNIYPNPFQNTFTVEYRNFSPYEFVIYDAFGRIIHQQTIVSSATIFIENLSEGLYFYRTFDDAGSLATGKLIKQ